ncbi:MAG: ShlB/FhaC/HecB family hemolysin secretion/activation protein [Myxococcota bacterium]
MRPRGSRRALFALVAAGGILASGAPEVAAQVVGAPVAREVLRDAPGVRPTDPQDLPAYDGERVLPPLPPPPDPRPPSAGTPPATEGARVVLRAIAFEGNVVLSDETLDEVAAPWLERPLGGTDLEALRDALTAAYVRAGYLTSGALFPGQALGRDARLVVRLVEGRLSRVDVSGATRVAPDYYASRILHGLDGPLHVPSLEARLRRLQRDPRLAGLHATIRPGERRGEAILDVAVEEKPAISAAVTVHNQLAPSLGEVRFGAVVANQSFSGAGDTLLVGGDWSEAGGGFEVAYRRPLDASDTLVHALGRYRRFDVSDGTGRRLDFESEYWSVEAGLYRPIRPVGRLEDWEFGVGLVGELAQSEITFLPTDEPFPLPGAPTGRTRLATLRLVLDAVHRQPGQVVALRSISTLGLDAFGATRSDDDLPDARFWAWNAQLQAARRFTDQDIELVGRVGLQLTNARVFGLAQFALGGHPSVRGYRQNRIVRDEGVVGGLEARIPLWRDAFDRRPIVQLVPFFDGGRAFSRHFRTDTLRSESLASVGVGLRARLGELAFGEFYWGAPLLSDGDTDGESALQDEGFHFRVTATWP